MVKCLIPNNPSENPSFSMLEASILEKVSKGRIQRPLLSRRKLRKKIVSEMWRIFLDTEFRTGNLPRGNA